MKWFKKRKEKKIKKIEEELKKIQQEASKIDGYEIIIPLRTNSNGEVIDFLKKEKILTELKNNGFKNIKKSQIILDSPIKEIGEFPIKIKFKHNLEAEIILITRPKEEFLEEKE